MKDIYIKVNGEIATGDGTVIVCGNKNKYLIHFDFSAEWKEFNKKTLRVKYGGKYYEELFEGEAVKLPVVSDTLGIEVGVYAGDLSTTTPAYFDCKKSILCGSGTHEQPPEDIYIQLLNSMKEPYIGENGNWFVFDATQGEFVDSGIPATPVIGVDNQDDSFNSLVSGTENTNSGNNSFLAGRLNKNEGKNAVITGYDNKNLLLDENNIDSSNNTFMCGSFNLSKGIGNAVFGRFLELIGGYKFGAGRFNKDGDGLIFQIGNGTDENNRSNAIAVDNEGNVYVGGEWLDDEGNVLYPSPFVHPSAGMVLAVNMTESINAQITGRGSANQLNRIVLSGTVAKYEGRKFVSIVDNQDGTIYQERIINIEARSGANAVNVEFTKETIDFTEWEASELVSRFTKATLFNANVEWSKSLDDFENINAKNINATEGGFSTLTTYYFVATDANIKSLDVKTLKVDGVTPLCIPEAAGGIVERVYMQRKSLLFKAEQSDIATFICGWVDRNNRMVVSKDLFLVEPESVIGEEIQLYTSATEFVTEAVVNVTERNATYYNVDYTANNVELGISKEDFVNTYCKVEFVKGFYEWTPTEEIASVEHSKDIATLKEAVYSKAEHEVNIEPSESGTFAENEGVKNIIVNYKNEDNSLYLNLYDTAGNLIVSYDFPFADEETAAVINLSEYEHIFGSWEIKYVDRATGYVSGYTYYKGLSDEVAYKIYTDKEVSILEEKLSALEARIAVLESRM